MLVLAHARRFKSQAWEGSPHYANRVRIPSAGFPLRASPTWGSYSPGCLVFV
jgi:hypothetical protein